MHAFFHFQSINNIILNKNLFYGMVGNVLVFFYISIVQIHLKVFHCHYNKKCFLNAELFFDIDNLPGCCWYNSFLHGIRNASIGFEMNGERISIPSINKQLLCWLHLRWDFERSFKWTYVSYIFYKTVAGVVLFSKNLVQTNEVTDFHILYSWIFFNRKK